MTERQRFEIIEKFPEFQLRVYEPCILAQMEISASYKTATNSAFRHLFNYISKGNQGATPISMTAPVIASTNNLLNSESWEISFVMPAGSSIKELPIPNDSKVLLSERPQEKCVALSFRGRATLERCEIKEAELRKAAITAGFTPSAEVRISRFDPPFKPGFMHYNEIVIPIAS